MLRFFRKIRQNLLENGNVRKYFWYAVGEVLLVVIGILIALQVNNWNENRTNKKQANELASKLLVEFKENQEQLNTVTQNQYSSKEAAQKILSKRNDSEYINNIDSLNQDFSKTYTTWTFNPVNGALRSGISSGDINFLKSDSLKILLFEWEDRVKDLDEDQQRIVDFEIRNRPYKSEFVPLLYVLNRVDTTLPESQFSPDYNELLNRRDFEEYLAWKHTDVTSFEIEVTELEKQLVTIIELLELELK